MSSTNCNCAANCGGNNPPPHPNGKITRTQFVQATPEQIITASEATKIENAVKRLQAGMSNVDNCDFNPCQSCQKCQSQCECDCNCSDDCANGM